jgi:hypothetical protein
VGGEQGEDTRAIPLISGKPELRFHFQKSSKICARGRGEVLISHTSGGRVKYYYKVYMEEFICVWGLELGKR